MIKEKKERIILFVFFFSPNWWQVSRDCRDASFASTILLHSLDAARSLYSTLFLQMHFINKDTKKLKGAI